MGLDYKLCTLGDGAVGKTALILRLCSDSFVEAYDPTIEDCYRKQFAIENEVAMLDILDTTGQEEFTVLRDQWITDSEGFLVVYSICSKRSFNQIKIFYEHIIQVKECSEENDHHYHGSSSSGGNGGNGSGGGGEDRYPIVLVGNKSDLEEEREVTTAEAQSLANSYHCKFVECSAKTNVNVHEAFAMLVREVRDFRHRRHAATSKLNNPSSSSSSSSFSFSSLRHHNNNNDSLKHNNGGGGDDEGSSSDHHHHHIDGGDDVKMNSNNSNSKSGGISKKTKKGTCSLL